MLGARLEIMEEGEHKLCLVEVPLELVEEEVEDREALEAEEDAEAMVGIPLLLNQQHKEVVAELAVMEAAAEVAVAEDWAILLQITYQGEEVQEVLAVLEEEAEAVVVLVVLATQLVVVWLV